MVRVGTWNTEWAKPGSPKGNRVSEALAHPDCDILCVTEGYAEILPGGGHVVDAGSDWGYPFVEGRRKVLLWSKQPWSDIDPFGSDQMPGGRFVTGTTQTGAGPLVVIGACIPWADANVKTGQRNRKRWEDHERWLAGFSEVYRRRIAEPTIVLGDFNQRIPRPAGSWVPKRVYALLRSAFEEFTFATAGVLAGAPAPGLAIDHIAHTPDLVLNGDIAIWPRRSEVDKHLPDHFGVWGDFELSSARRS